MTYLLRSTAGQTPLLNPKSSRKTRYLLPRFCEANNQGLAGEARGADAQQVGGVVKVDSRTRSGLYGWLALVSIIASGCQLTDGTGAAATPTPSASSSARDPGAYPRASSLAGRVAFGNQAGGITIMGFDGSSPRQVTVPGGTDFDPHWSPDAKWIVFRTMRYKPPSDPQGTGYDGIFVIDANGANEHAINPVGGGLFPSWSPDGRTIMFSGPNARGNETLLAYDVPSATTRDSGVYGEGVQWSPDGRLLAVDRFRGNGVRADNWEIWRMQSDDSQLTQLTDEPGADHAGGWSSDGRSIVYAAAPDGNQDVWVMAADGSNKRRLIDWPGVQSPDEWLPDGRILFADYSRGRPLPDWYLVNPGGGHLEFVPQLAQVNPPLDWHR
jgi:Tol biopolymer transport system component